MSDPLSIAASVGGLALLAKEIVQGISSVIESVRGAKAEMQRLSLSVATLYGILKSLSLVLDQLPSTDVTTPGKASFGCSATLDDIQKLLAKCGSDGNTSVNPAVVANPSTWNVTKHRAIWVVKKPEIEKLIDDLEGHKSTLQLAMTQNSLSGIVEILRRQDEAMSELKVIKESQAQIWAAKISEDERRFVEEQKKLLEEISSLHPRNSLQKHLGLHQDGTGLWFINGPAFEEFRNTSNSRLWLYGIPGAGKSVLSATIINSLEKSEKMATAFFFCEYGNRDTQTIRQILGSIARQLVVQNPASFAVLEDFHRSYQDSHHFSKVINDSDWVELVQDLSASFDTTTIVIDGLDECLEHRGEIVQHLATLSSRGSIKLLFASREELDIKEALSAFESLPIAADRADVRLYVAAHLDLRFKQMTSKDPTLRKEILESLVNRSEGMFQWVKCQLDHLESLPSNHLRRKALNDLPPDLPQTYQRILHRAIASAPDCTLKFIERTLRWIALAKYPMSLAAITNAISIEPGEKEYDKTLEIKSILKSCSSLVRTVNDTVAFSHFSVKEYLCQIDIGDQELSRFRVNKEKDQDYLASVCLSYLLLKDFSALHLRDSTSWDHYTTGHPFYHNAAQTWLDYARDSKDPQVLELELELFKPEKSDQLFLWAYTWLPHHADYHYKKDLRENMFDITPLHLACACSLPEVVDSLIKKGTDVNISNEMLQTPLICALSGRTKEYGVTWDKSFEVIKRLLLEDISRDKAIHDPLQEAAKLDDERVTALLLDKGFPVTKGALEKAMEVGPSRMKMFITHTATLSLDPEAEPLFKKTLVDYHLTSSHDGGQTVPSRAAMEHFKGNYQQILPIAASHGRLETVSSLLPCLSTISEEERNELLSLCLSHAATNSQAEVINFLIDKGADPSFQRKSDGRTVLHDVVLRCGLKTISHLLQSCRDPRSVLETEDHEGFTPWLHSVQISRMDVLDHFLEVHPNLDFQQKTTLGLTAAHLAIELGGESLFHYLQEHSVDFESPAADGRRPIHMLLERLAERLAWRENIQMLRNLIVLENDLSTRTESGMNLLHLLVDAGQPLENLNEILQYLLEDGRYRSSRENALISTDSHLRTPLHLSLEKLCENLNQPGLDFEHHLHQVRLLATPPFEFRGHLSVRGDQLRTPILAFSSSVSNIEVPETSKDRFQSIVLDVFRILIESEKDGSFTGQQDDDGMTAMHYVAESKSSFPFEEVMSAFLKHSIDFSVKDKQGDTPLMVAARTESENIDFLRLALPCIKIAGLDEPCGDGVPLIHHICKKSGVEKLFPNHLASFAQSTVLDEDGYMPLVQLLKSITDMDVASRMIEVAGKTIDACDNMKRSCLYWACRLGADPVVAALIDRYNVIDNALLDPQPDGSVKEYPPLLVAALHGNVETVKMLIQKGANVFVKDDSYWQLHHFAMAEHGYPSLLDFLETVDGLDYEAPITFHWNNHKPPRRFEHCKALHLAAANQRNMAPLEWLLASARNLNLNSKTACGTTNLEACKLLVIAGASPFETDRDGSTPFHLACQSGSLGICRYLLSISGTLAVTNEQAPESPAEIASQRGDIGMVKVLLHYNCPVSALAELNALRAGNLELAELIREELQTQQVVPGDEEGASEEIAASRLDIICQMATSEAALITLVPHLRNLDRRVTTRRETPLHIASKSGWTSAVSALIDRGASLNLLDILGNTPLLTAAGAKQLECTRILHHNGSDVTQRDQRGLTGLHLAAIRGDCDSVEYFFGKKT